MTHQEAINKVVKLLRLAKSSNENEAALAAARAQEIMTRHQIEASALSLDENKPQEEADEPIMDFDGDVLWQGAHAKTTWRVRLAQFISKQNQVKIYLRHNGIALVGRPGDCQTVRYLYSWLQQEVQRLSNEKTKGFSSAYGNAWRNGCVMTVGHRLDQMRKETLQAVRAETGDNKLALVRIDNAIARIERRQLAVDAFYADMSKGWGKGRSRYDGSGNSGYQAGMRDGKQVRITAAKGGIGKGSAGQIGGGN